MTSIRLPGTPQSIPDARRWTTKTLNAAGYDDDAVCTAELIVSELATNAVRHTRSGRPNGEYDVEIRPGAGQVRLQVADEGGTEHEPIVPSPRPSLDDLSDHGVGLWMVNQMALRMGIIGDVDGRTVYADIRARTALTRDDALNNMRIALTLRGVDADFDERRGVITARGPDRNVVLLAGENGWSASIPNLSTVFGAEYTLARDVRALLYPNTQVSSPP